ncbi:MAG: pantetheine-phosphate adenylyltransferase [Elusimicrobia bacterium RIFOXYB2_FULL_49_7]|nr:MAG: pantetheine-phosphate adenylyltransferase [Elusimicrobia bacterium RIFOXYB2_FULL_49_7]
MVKRVIYPGTFDPITNGHLDILQRALKLFTRVEVVVGDNPQKRCLFTLEERIDLVRESVCSFRGVSVRPHSGLLVNMVKKRERAIFIRGLRAVSDFEYELQMAMMNRHLNSNVETVFLMPNEKYIFLSSSLTKDISRFNGDIRGFLPAPVYEALKRKNP